MLNMLDNSDLLPGFPEPVNQSQVTFRAVLNAMSRPGTIVTCGADLAPPAPLHPATGAFLLTMADFETPVWVGAHLQDSNAATWLKFHCSCPMAAVPSSAPFAVISDQGRMPPLEHFAQGTEDYPDRSTTLIIQVGGLKTGSGLQLRGPGIQDKTGLAVDGLSELFWVEWADNHYLFPLGVDLVLTSGTDLVALPRTTMVEF